jgi:hypothetical protein
LLGDCALAAEPANAISKAMTACKPEIHLLERVRIFVTSLIAPRLGNAFSGHLR